MEKMPKLTWEKILDYATYDYFYTLQIRGVDEAKRNFFYTGKIEKVNRYLQGGAIKTGYRAEYKLYENGSNFQLKPCIDMKEPFDTLAEAKKWVSTAFKTFWTKTHK